MGNNKEFIDFLHERERLMQLITLETTLTTLYIKICKCNNINEVKNFLAEKIDLINLQKMEYNQTVLENPTIHFSENLGPFQVSL